jgi:hypothetical protein
VCVDDRPVVFYHYHSLRIWRPRLWLKPVLMAGGSYTFASDAVRTIYRPYLRELWDAVSALENAGSSVVDCLTPMTWEGIVTHQLRLRQLAFSVGTVAAAPA